MNEIFLIPLIKCTGEIMFKIYGIYYENKNFYRINMTIIRFKYYCTEFQGKRRKSVCKHQILDV